MRTLYAIGDGFYDRSGETFRDLAYAGDSRYDGFRHAPPPALQMSPTEVESARQRLTVGGSYMTRLPLACVKAGLVDYAEEWLWTRDEPRDGTAQPLMGYRTFSRTGDTIPFHSTSMIRYLDEVGPPEILCIWGLGVDERVVARCGDSFKIYYSTGVRPIRTTDSVISRMDLILVGEEWQRRAVHQRFPGVPCELMPIGPEFADPQTFRPLGGEKEYDLIYVGSARGCKRHDLLFRSLAAHPRELRCLCVMGHGPDYDAIAAQAADLGLRVDFVPPPGVAYETVNAYMNMARVGVVAGIDDGCPAVLVEYMMAGLPVVVNNELRCGTRFINEHTGRVAAPDMLAAAVDAVIAGLDSYRPREYALEHWSWPVSVRRLRHATGAR